MIGIEKCSLQSDALSFLFVDEKMRLITGCSFLSGEAQRRFFGGGGGGGGGVC